MLLLVGPSLRESLLDSVRYIIPARNERTRRQTEGEGRLRPDPSLTSNLQVGPSRMNVLAVPHPSSGRDAALEVAQSLARRTGGRWSALHALRPSFADVWPGRRTRRMEALRRQLATSTTPDPDPVDHQIAWRPLRSLIRREVARSGADVIVSHGYDAVEDPDDDSLADLLVSGRRPVLFVRRPLPRRVRKAVVVTVDDDERDEAIRRSIDWLRTLTEYAGEKGAIDPSPTEVSVLLVRTEEAGLWDTHVRRQEAPSESTNDRIVVSLPMPVRSRHVPGTIRLLEPDLVVLCAPFRSRGRAVRMVEGVLDCTEAPLLVLSGQ